jgi:putative SOS response-associated peptidase YedK
MCGRYTLTLKRSDLERSFPAVASLPEDRVFCERFNIAPSQEAVVISRPDGSQPTAELMRWGLVPHWSKGPQGEVKMINARAETLAERPAYRGLVASASGRCLIPADGFYEWQQLKPGTKQPWRYTLANGEPFAFAGLCETWTPAEGGEPLRSFTVVTTEPNNLVAEVHDRMPAILATAAAREARLDPELEPAATRTLLAPLESGAMAAERVSRAVGKPSNEGPGLLVPEQQQLF